jgi:hypothetical protein
MRAKKLASMTKKKHKEIQLMDCDGSFLSQYRHQVKKMYGEPFLNSLTIEVVHQKIYPRDSLLLYKDFSGVAKSWKEVCLLLKNHPIEFLFSFSLARAAKSYQHSLIAHTSDRRCVWRVKKLKCDRPCGLRHL